MQNEVEHNVFLNNIFNITRDFEHNNLQNRMRTHSTVTEKNLLTQFHLNYDFARNSETRFINIYSTAVHNSLRNILYVCISVSITVDY